MLASYPFLDDPRNGQGRPEGEDKEKGWRLNVRGDQNDPKVKAFLQEIKEFMKEAWGPNVGNKKGVSNPLISKNGMPMRPEMVQVDDGSYEKTGFLTMKVSRGLIDNRNKKPQGGPVVVDSGLKDWPQSLRSTIGNDSLVSVKLHFWAWDRRSEGEGVGLSAELHGVQVIEHVAYEGGSSEVTADGFAAVAGGAVAPDAPEEDFQNLPPADDFSQQLRKAAEETEQNWLDGQDNEELF